MKKLLKKVKKSVSKKSKALLSSVSNFASSKKVKLTVAVVVVLSVLSAGLYGAFQLRGKSYYQGCLDGGAMGLVQVLPYAAGQIIANRATIFGGLCGDLRSQTSHGKSLDDLLKSAEENQDNKDKSAPQKQQDPQENPEENSSN